MLFISRTGARRLYSKLTDQQQQNSGPGRGTTQCPYISWSQTSTDLMSHKSMEYNYKTEIIGTGSRSFVNWVVKVYLYSKQFLHLDMDIEANVWGTVLTNTNLPKHMGHNGSFRRLVFPLSRQSTALVLTTKQESNITQNTQLTLWQTHWFIVKKCTKCSKCTKYRLATCRDTTEIVIGHHFV